jgi:radical S-adenosyl methionine domain-containing protein 2
VPESNEIIKKSYLILDENIRFLDKNNGEEKANKSILDISVRKAITQIK